jgi:2-methylcitrate dehydratase PrpD
MAQITHRPVQKADKILAVITGYEQQLDIIDQTKNGQNGGVRCHFDDGSMVSIVVAIDRRSAAMLWISY